MDYAFFSLKRAIDSNYAKANESHITHRRAASVAKSR